MNDTNMQSSRQAAELINRAIAMDLWSLTDHTKVTRQEFLDALARIQQQAQEREGEIARLRALLRDPINLLSRPDDWICQCGNHNAAVWETCGDCGAKLTAEAKPEAPAMVEECTNCGHEVQPHWCFCANCGESGPAIRNGHDKDCPIVAALATPCECAELREDVEQADKDRQDMSAEIIKLRSELAAANERAERAERGLQYSHDRKTFWKDEAVKLADALRTAQTGWKEAVEALRRVRQGYMNILEFRQLDSERWGQRDGYGGRYGALTEDEIREAIAPIDPIVARFDAQGGK